MITGVDITRQDGIATLSIDGRTDLNLLGPAVFQALHQQVTECGADETVRAIVLQGAGDRAFSAALTSAR